MHAMTESGSRRLIEALARSPTLFGPDVRSVELLETHISWVLLAGDDAYKIKKPVDFGFLDFSTLERRRQFYEEELRPNGRLAPELFLEVVLSAEHPIRPSLGDVDLLSNSRYGCGGFLKGVSWASSLKAVN